MNVIMVGQAPSRMTDGLPPFSGRSGARLARLAGVPQAELLRLLRPVNLVDAWPGKAGKGDAFDAAEAARGAARIDLSAHDRALLVGQNVARAFGLRRMPVLEWTRVSFGGREALVAVLPHPSGVNLWWNSPENAARAAAFLTELRAMISAPPSTPDRSSTAPSRPA